MASVVALYAKFALRAAERLRPQAAARFLLSVRLLPAGLGVCIPLGLCLPSYLWLEPGTPEEMVGIPFLMAAALGAIVCATAIMRAVRIAIDGARFIRNCRQSGNEFRLDGHGEPVFAIGSLTPFLALAGVFRPRVVISEGMLRALSAEELAVALRHESAHRASRDNLKRFGISVVPLPFFAGQRCLDKGWSRVAEFAADEEAVRGDSRRALALASALVRVARGGGEPRSEFAISFLGELPDLSLRVDRLLAGAPAAATAIHRHSRSAAAMPIALVCLAIFVLRPSTLHGVQAILERLIQ